MALIIPAASAQYTEVNVRRKWSHIAPNIGVAPLKNRGVLLVLLLLLAGLAAAIGAYWYQYRQTRHALAFWDGEVASLINRAPLIELVRFGSSESDSTSADVRSANDRADISSAPGVVHFRRSLLEDASFDWEATPSIASDKIGWDYAVQFSDQQTSATILVDFDEHIVALSPSNDRLAKLNDKMAAGAARFFAEQFAKSAATR